ncbi:hypothetical protein HUO13_27235 [Saccharopolyspora erythraea]|uniref:WD40 repeat domain-containing protein n=1 Tax=Saccharopolyspora erythraea TaxID=1836 RepID=UPI001BAD4237|nr:hypothetical protein [Saccharopolyspora erythraea]QUH04021.1 hypothetical protein HUO13_27235 [Saccharopolyspora erythraea]
MAADIPFDQSLSGVAFTSHRNTLVVQASSGPVRLWDLTDLRHPVPIEDRRFDADTEDARFIDNHTLAASTGNDNKVRLWDLTDPRHAALLSGLASENGVEHLQTSPDEKTVAGVTGSGELHIWDVTNPRDPSDVGTIPDISAQGVEFGHDGYTAAVATSSPPGFAVDSTGVLLFDLDPDRLYRYLCSINGQPITADQWKQLVPDHPYQEPCR